MSAWFSNGLSAWLLEVCLHGREGLSVGGGSLVWGWGSERREDLEDLERSEECWEA